jgi:crotonobetainyl-CoA:carnitine CoA-transferase CaiB-like acyl-CoA transferase
MIRARPVNRFWKDTKPQTTQSPPVAGRAPARSRESQRCDRVAHIDETDALVGAWTQTLGKMEVFTITKRYRIPCAPSVDNIPEIDIG